MSAIVRDSAKLRAEAESLGTPIEYSDVYGTYYRVGAAITPAQRAARKALDDAFHERLLTEFVVVVSTHAPTQDLRDAAELDSYAAKAWFAREDVATAYASGFGQACDSHACSCHHVYLLPRDLDSWETDGRPGLIF